VEPLYGTLIVAAVGVLVQVVTGYGTYKFFTGKIEQQMAEHERRLNHIDQGQASQWNAVREVEKSVAYMQGVQSKGKGGGI